MFYVKIYSMVDVPALREGYEEDYTREEEPKLFECLDLLEESKDLKMVFPTVEQVFDFYHELKQEIEDLSFSIDFRKGTFYIMVLD